MEENILEDYRQRAGYASDEAQKCKKLAETYSLYRLGVFGLFILCVCIAISVDEIVIIGVGLAIMVVWFSWLIKKQSHFDERKNYWLDMQKVNENEISSIQSNTNMYDNGAIFYDDKHYYTSDLDIFGNNSLFQLINRSATSPGIGKLAEWLNAPADKSTILLRQQAIEEIAAKNDWKLEMQTFLLFSMKQQREQIKHLLSYLKIPVELDDKKWLHTYCKIAPWLLLAVIVVSIFYMPARYFIPVVALFNYRQVTSRKKIIDKTDLLAGKIGATLAHFVMAFQSVENEEWSSPALKDLAAKIKRNEGKKVSEKIQELSQLINKLNYRLNMVMQVILNAFFVWDIRQIIAIENWKRDNQQGFETAFDAIAEFEALMSLAGLRINYPDWAVPQIAGGSAYTLVAKGIAHPLISPKRRIENDYTLDDSFNIDIITGSNMAGKSTFLRTIGINTVLALCGAPVCAQEMKVSVMTVITYMRIKDSLNESTSTFKAELDRLQMLIKAVEGEQKVFFLIDEMLRGTNSVDKYLGSKAVIERLISKKGVGLVATHDLQIAELEAKYPDYIRNFYFDIQVLNGEMIFDYKMKHGECKTFNASLLLKQIGIDVGE